MTSAGKTSKIEEKTKLTMLYKIINEIANVPNKEIIIPAETRIRSKHGHKFCMVINDINEYKYSWTISQWNCLSKALVDNETVETVNAFKHGWRISTLHLSYIGHISIYTPIGVSANYLFRFRFWFRSRYCITWNKWYITLAPCDRYLLTMLTLTSGTSECDLI